MSESVLEKRVDKFLQKSIDLLAGYPSLRGLQRRLQKDREGLREPMRVAVVGKIKAGKSTAMNALLGEALVAVGTVEATFNINWLKYGEEPSLRVNFKDDRPPETRSSAELTELTKRSEDPANIKFLQSIKYIEVFHPNPILKSLDLIDTPGLFSTYGVDSDNTSEFLKVHGAELNNITETEVSKADAILYLFSNSSLSDSDRKVIQEFQGAAVGRASPLNAIAVLTQVDNYDAPEPLVAAEGITQRLMNEHGELRNLFHKIQPIAGLLALGAQTLDLEDFTILQRLANLPTETLAGLLRSADRFATREYPDKPEIPIAIERNRVLKRLDLYGIKLACKLISEGVSDRENLAELLLNKSGIPELRELIISHFGSRAYLIKFNRYLPLIKDLLFRENSKQIDGEKAAVAEIAKLLDRLECDEFFFQNLRELQVLGNLYDKQIQHQLELDESEQQQLLEVTGERGTACAARLGLPPDATLAQMREQIEAKLKYWRSCSADPGNNPIRRQTATIISQSFDRLAYHIDEAERHLNLSEQDIDRVALSKVLVDCLDISELTHLSDRWQEICRGYVDWQLVEEYNKWLQQLKNICFMGRQKYKDAQLESIQKLAACIEKVEANDLNLKELKLWQSYQEGKLTLNPEEVKELQNIIGKNGTTLFMRLGLEPTTQLSAMPIQIEKCKNYWIELANDPFGCDPQTRWAANIFIFIYDRLHYHLEEARYHLELN